MATAYGSLVRCVMMEAPQVIGRAAELSREREGSAESAAEALPSREELYERHKARVYHLCLRFGGGNEAWAEDTTHDVFIKLFENMHKLGDHAELAPWLYRVTANCCYSRLQREGSIWGKVRARLFAESEREDHQTPERRVRVKRDLQSALAALEALPPKERVVFTMRFLDERPQHEIAETLSLSKGYVSKLVARAQARLTRLQREPATVATRGGGA